MRLRLAAALLAAGRCDTAVAAARSGQALDPDNVLGPLVIGACQEKAERYDLAVATYGDFADRYPEARGVAALRGKALVALRAHSAATARRALAREAELTSLPPEPRTLAVLPVTIAGDTQYRALSRGLAELITTDLAQIRSLRLLERLQIGALLDELRLAETQRVDPGTAARVGRLLRAERMVQGLASIPSGRGAIRLQVALVGGDGAVRQGPEVTGPFRRLLDLEKELVIRTSAELGVQLTQAERQRILAEGPKSLAAFLAYSAGLEASDRGDYAAAARHFTSAVQADPSFRAAEQQRQAAEAAPVVQQATTEQVVTVVAAVAQVVAPTEPVSSAALSSSTLDVAPSLSDALAQTTGTGTEATLRQVAPENAGIANVQGVSGTIRISFPLPTPQALWVIYRSAPR